MIEIFESNQLIEIHGLVLSSNTINYVILLKYISNNIVLFLPHNVRFTRPNPPN